ncbi:CBS domain-containing protein [Nocardia sp. NPDC049190]|uniref:CBS domain-containing protein n=1 Tax=Nocardia sp. NPDC049190 TaxID=3155650 RepID=UPI0033EF7A6B
MNLVYARDIFSRPVVTARPDTPLPEAISLLTEGGFAALPVVDEQDRVIGMLSEGDALAARIAHRTATVAAVMTVPAEVIQPGTTVSAIASRMLTGNLRSMPVVEAGVLVGIVARRDLLRALARNTMAVEADIHALLDNYVGSRRQWSVEIAEGRAIIRGRFADEDEQRTIAELVRTVNGVDDVEIVADPPLSTRPPTMPLTEWLQHRADDSIV